MVIVAKASDFVVERSFGRPEISELASTAARLGFQYSRGPHSITIHPRNDSGFTVFLSVRDSDCFVCFGDLQQDIDDPKMAVALATGAISGACRLQIASRGGVPCRWTLQRQSESGEWIDAAASGHTPILRRFKAETIEYKSNGASAD